MTSKILWPNIHGKDTSMFVQISYTPNPKTIKFIPGLHVSDEPSEFRREDSSRHPFLEAVFEIEDVDLVFLGPDFVSVSIRDGADWDTGLKENISGLIALFADGLHQIKGKALTAEVDPVGDARVVAKIKELLESHVRPAVASDGGDIIFKGFDEGVLTLEMRGACSGCPSSTATLRHGIQSLMRHFVPEVKEVRAAN